MKYRPGIGSTAKARELRANSTDAERAMWRLLRENFSQARFRRQVPIRQYIADFASHRKMVVIEIDGGQHNEELDRYRTRAIEEEGYLLVRFWNHDVLSNPEGVHSALVKCLHAPHPRPTLPHQGGGEK